MKLKDLFEKARFVLHPLTLVSMAAKLSAEADALRKVAEEERERADALERRSSAVVRARWGGTCVYDEVGMLLASYYVPDEVTDECRGNAYWNVPFGPAAVANVGSVEEARRVIEDGLATWGCFVEPEAQEVKISSER